MWLARTPEEEDFFAGGGFSCAGDLRGGYRCALAEAALEGLGRDADVARAKTCGEGGMEAVRDEKRKECRNEGCACWGEEGERRGDEGVLRWRVGASVGEVQFVPETV